MARTTITMPDGLTEEAHKRGICVSHVASNAVMSEIVSRVEQEKKAGLYKEVK
jgi:hypothetical protein